MNPSYIAKNQEELFDQSPANIQQLIIGDEINKTTAILGKVYKLPVGLYVPLSNIISFILIGALLPKDVLIALQDVLKLSPDDAYKMANDLEKSILEKARVSILGKSNEGVVTLTFNGANKSPDELRKEILDTTKRESGLMKNQSTVNSAPITTKKPIILTPGSRSQLLEQLQILDSIPNDEEISARLEQIKDQMASLDVKEGGRLDSNIALKEFMFGEKGDTLVKAESKSATYSKAPTKYNIDPYKEIVES